MLNKKNRIVNPKKKIVLMKKIKNGEKKNLVNQWELNSYQIMPCPYYYNKIKSLHYFITYKYFRSMGIIIIKY